MCADWISVPERSKDGRLGPWCYTISTRQFPPSHNLKYSLPLRDACRWLSLTLRSLGSDGRSCSPSGLSGHIHRRHEHRVFETWCCFSMPSSTAHHDAEHVRPMEPFFGPDWSRSPVDGDSEDLPSPADHLSPRPERSLDRRHGADHHRRRPSGASWASCGADEEDDIDDVDDVEADPPNPPSPSSEDGLGDDEPVDVAVDAYSWKIDHSQGHHRLRGE